MSKEIPCPKCGHVWLWVNWKKDKDAFCPKGYGCASEDKITISDDLVKRALADRIEALEAENARLKADKAKAVAQMQRVKDFRYDPSIGIELNFLERILAELTEGRDRAGQD